MIKANVRLYGPVRPDNDGVTLATDNEITGCEEADANRDGTVTAYIDLKHPGDFADHGIWGSSLDLTADAAGFRWLANLLNTIADENWPES